MRNIIRLNIDNYTENVWGGRWLPTAKGLPAGETNVGESWEFSTHTRHPSWIVKDGVKTNSLIDAFPSVAGAATRGGSPFLIKIIDARQSLSLQVHPGDAYAQRTEHDAGKAESWVVLDAGRSSDEGALYVGFNPAERARFASDAEFARAFRAAVEAANAKGEIPGDRERAAAAESVLRFVNRGRVSAGDVFHLPPGTVHALGAGVRLYEIQQSSDVTYRIWDWNRTPRPMHVEKAFDVLDVEARSADAFRPPPDAGLGGLDGRVVRLVSCREGSYRASSVDFLASGAAVDVETGGRFHVLTVVAGSVSVETEDDAELLGPYTTAVVPATLTRYRLRAASDEARVIKAEHLRA